MNLSNETTQVLETLPRSALRALLSEVGIVAQRRDLKEDLLGALEIFNVLGNENADEVVRNLAIRFARGRTRRVLAGCK